MSFQRVTFFSDTIYYTVSLTFRATIYFQIIIINRHQSCLCTYHLCINHKLSNSPLENVALHKMKNISHSKKNIFLYERHPIWHTEHLFVLLHLSILSFGISPNETWNNKSTNPQIREKLQNYYSKFTKTKPRFKIGDIVRIKLLPKSSFSKGYDIQNNQELFEIHKITSNLPIPMYQIKSIDKPEEDVIKGKFYGHELTLASKE